MARGIKRKPEQLPRTDPRTIVVTNVVHDTSTTEDASQKSNKMDQKQGSVSDITYSADGSKMNNNDVSTKDSVCGKEIVQLTPVNGDGGAQANNPMPENIQYNEYNPPPDMGTKITDDGIMLTLKQCVKHYLFCNVKFFISNHHDVYSTNPGTLCGKILIHCHSEKWNCDKDWWDNHKGTVIKTITNMRNNSIKRIKELYQGMCNHCNAFIRRFILIPYY